MRTSILLFFLLFFSTLTSQNWQAAEWINIAGKKDSGQVKIPTRKWKKLSDIQLKPATHKWYEKTTRVNDLVLLYTLDGDTLLNTVFFNEVNIWLQTLLKGKVSLLREVTSKNNHFIVHKGKLAQLSRFEFEEQMFDFSEEDCKCFHKPHYANNTKGALRATRALNKCFYDKEPKWLSYKRNKYKWRYTLGSFSSEESGFPISRGVKRSRKYHFQLGVERNFSSAIPFLSFLLQTSYSESIVKDHYGSYDRKIERSLLKSSTGLRAEPLFRRTISPFISGGIIIAASLKSKWSFKINRNRGLNGLPTRKEINAQFSPKTGFFYGTGLRFNLSEKTRLNIMIRVESYLSSNNSERIQFGDIGIAHKTIPNEFMVGVVLTRAFSMGL